SELFKVWAIASSRAGPTTRPWCSRRGKLGSNSAKTGTKTTSVAVIRLALPDLHTKNSIVCYFIEDRLMQCGMCAGPKPANAHSRKQLIQKVVAQSVHSCTHRKRCDA